MAEFIFETSASIKGPWLLDSRQLGELEKILDEEWTRLKRRNEELIRVEAESRFKNDYQTTAEALLDKHPSEEELRARKERIETDVRGSYKFAEKRSITIYLEADKKLIVESFAEAIRQQIVLEETARAFEAVIACGDIKCNIDLSRIDGSLNLRVSPEELPEAREFFATLKTWSMASRPPKWLVAWSLINPLHWLLYLIILVLVVLLAGMDQGEQSKQFYKEQAKQLLDRGLTEEDRKKATEILLALESNYTVTAGSIKNPGLVLCVLDWGRCDLCRFNGSSQIFAGNW